MKWPFWTRSAQPDDCETIDPLLSLFADGMASAEEARRVEAHLLGCAECREALEWMRATQRVLSARPVVSPPADLRARIADAIAASSESPVPAVFSVRPARVFALRPALAAAASLSILGLIGYGLLHPVPHPTVSPVSPPIVVANASPVTVPTTNILPPVIGKSHTKRHSIIHTKSVLLEMEKVAAVNSDAEPTAPTPEVKPTVKSYSRPLPQPVIFHLPTVKKAVSKKPNFSLMANKTITPPTETVKIPVVTPDEKKNETVAAVPNRVSPVAVTVAPTIIHQDTTAMVASSNGESHPQNADLLGSVNAHFREMKHLFHSTGGNSIKGAVLASHTIDPDRTAYVPGVYTP